MSGRALRKMAFILLGLAVLREVAWHRHGYGCESEDEEEGAEAEHGFKHGPWRHHHGPWRHMRFGPGFGPGGPDKDWVPPMVEEWHRRLHEREQSKEQQA